MFEDINNLQDNRIDYRFNTPSLLSYFNDLETKGLNKLCMTEVVNADLSIAMVGEGEYRRGCKEVLERITHNLKLYNLDHCIFVYVYNYKNFIVAANDGISNEDFTKIMQAFYDEYELSTASNNNLSAVSRFVLVFGKEDMLDRATSAHYVNRDMQINFFVATNERETMRNELQRNMEVFHLINYAILNNTVVPFYQGIYDNEAKKINKYEALMRIYDERGKIYAPAKFLEEAKQLKLYPKISKIMLEKALNEFENKSSELSLNISLFDIQSEEFRTWFLEKVASFPNPSKLIIEFVETENYSTDEIMNNFIADARKLGCKIAVDDFGVGFATYNSIIALKPEIIKIDGSIIKRILKNDENRIILDSICYMARLIHSKVVAEYIENEEIQKIVLENKVDFSQGYFFAKPLPMHELDVE